jgi:hypothetical protein
MKRNFDDTNINNDNEIDGVFKAHSEISKHTSELISRHVNMLRKALGNRFIFVKNNDEESTDKESTDKESNGSWYFKKEGGDWKKYPSDFFRRRAVNIIFEYFDKKREQVTADLDSIDQEAEPDRTCLLNSKVMFLTRHIMRLKGKNDNYSVVDGMIEEVEEIFAAKEIPQNTTEKNTVEQTEPSAEPEKKADEDMNTVSRNSSSVNKSTISSTMKRLVWNINIGEEVGKSKCTCCKTTDITQMSFHCGHVIANAKGGETIVSNLKPICQNCNSSMRTQNMNDFMKSLI